MIEWICGGLILWVLIRYAKVRKHDKEMAEHLAPYAGLER